MREATASVTKNADRLINSARVLSHGIEVAFADGRSGVIPFDDIRGIDQELLSGIELPSQHELILRATTGESVDIPWDFARHYCDPAYQEQSEATASRGRSRMGQRVRDLRKQAGMTQEQLANAAGIGRVTLVRIENGSHSPRFRTLDALARAPQPSPRAPPPQRRLTCSHPLDVQERMVYNARKQPTQQRALDTVR